MKAIRYRLVIMGLVFLGFTFFCGCDPSAACYVVVEANDLQDSSAAALLSEAEIDRAIEIVDKIMQSREDMQVPQWYIEQKPEGGRWDNMFRVYGARKGASLERVVFYLYKEREGSLLCFEAFEFGGVRNNPRALELQQTVYNRFVNEFGERRVWSCVSSWEDGDDCSRLYRLRDKDD
ncbi:hypothetical protein STSP2_00307 [Anaerohalosphaera lusitana]|uniref:Lipoprotein n=1 Tax=Anaerohalosphaera lusitana TaxID=1936003 RepID=A0A1U9NHD8_9BACT|nr:hypothetical protein [Anaerohalosphaera lusitana]AQT67164.1 hypothetical protein STSP2_00307 [Anaerohalosphaera lusitana]